MRLALITLLLTACTTTELGPIELEPRWEGRGAYMSVPENEWRAVVNAAAWAWADACEGVDAARPFVLGDELPVTLEGAWAIAGMGATGDAGIGIRGDLQRWQVESTLLHELGHALGLEHEDGGIMADQSTARMITKENARLACIRSSE